VQTIPPLEQGICGKEGTTSFEAFYCYYFLIFDTGKTTTTTNQMRMTEQVYGWEYEEKQ
jgi:hypothetical protein